MLNNNIKGIKDISISVNDVDKTVSFLSDFGLQTIDNYIFKTLDGSSITLNSDCKDEFNSITWYVDDIDLVCAVLISNRINYKDFRPIENKISLKDCHDYTIILEQFSKTISENRGTATNSLGNNVRINSPVKKYERAYPYEIAHVVLFSDDIETAEKFYTDLGFVVSDRLLNRGIFLRAAALDYHHRLFLIQSEDKGLHHIAFSVGDIYELFAGGQHMQRSGWRTAKGPGRHNISSATYWYFNTPSNFMIEYSADSDILNQDWIPQNYEYNKEIINDEDFIINRK